MASQTIPQEILDVANSPELFDKIEAATKPLDLYINQIGELDMIVRKTLKGIIPREQILEHIAETLEVDDVTANRILKIVNLEIFQKLREIILETHQNQEGGKAEETLAHIEDPRGAVVANNPSTRIPINILTKASPHDLAQIPGEVAHNVPHMEQLTEVQTPKQTNPLQSLSVPKHNPMESEVLQAKKPQDVRGYTGIDPYREPLN